MIHLSVDDSPVGVDQCRWPSEIEAAVNHLSAVLDVAYFNAGLAFGITFADLRVTR